MASRKMALRVWFYSRLLPPHRSEAASPPEQKGEGIERVRKVRHFVYCWVRYLPCPYPLSLLGKSADVQRVRSTFVYGLIVLVFLTVLKSYSSLSEVSPTTIASGDAPEPRHPLPDPPSR
jgi:hypothetical protein